MQRLATCGWLALLAACSAPTAETYVLVNQATGERTELVRRVVLDGYNIDGTARAGWTEYEATLDQTSVAVVGLETAMPAQLVASTEISHHTSLMFIAFSGDRVTANISAPFDAERPDFDDFTRVADLADTWQICASSGTCAALDSDPLRTGDIVIVQLP